MAAGRACARPGRRVPRTGLVTVAADQALPPLRLWSLWAGAGRQGDDRFPRGLGRLEDAPAVGTQTKGIVDRTARARRLRIGHRHTIVAPARHLDNGWNALLSY